MDTTGGAAGGGVLTDPREQCDGDWAFWCDLLEAMLYQGKVPAKAKVAACLQAVSAGNPTELWLQAHALKGTCAALCLPQLRQRCAELERSSQVPAESAGWLAQVREIEALLNRLEVTYKWARSLGDAARAGALEAVNGQWEALPVYLNTEPHHQRRDLTAKLERRSSHSAAMLAEASC